jgi:general secretion pathway protein G
MARTNRLLGFSLIELMICAVILSVLALAVTPLAHWKKQREKETELRLALREIRFALDAYKKAADEGQIPKLATESGYPKSLVDLEASMRASKSPSDETPRLRFIRKIPRDPMSDAAIVDPSETWGLRSYKSSASEPKAGEDVYDIYSKSGSIGLNGIAYNQW